MEIKELQIKYKLSKDDFWEVRAGRWVITHDACERIANEEGIIFKKPEVYQLPTSLCLIGEATLKDKTIWSTGEASADNVKMAGKYYWSMAEKRLKDRLTLKLINAYEYGIYSDAEAEEFKKPIN